MPRFLSPDTRSALERVLALDSAGTSPDGDALQRVRAVRTLQAALDADGAILHAVRDAVQAGVGWEEIADAAQLSLSAARWRWQGTDAEIAARVAAGRKRSARPSSVPADLPGLSVADAAARLGVTAQAIYLRITRGTLAARTVELADGRSYKRVFLDGDDVRD